MGNRPLALITGASRKKGIGAAAALELAKEGWDIAVTYWTDYDRSMPWGSDGGDLALTSDHTVFKPALRGLEGGAGQNSPCRG